MVGWCCWGYAQQLEQQLAVATTSVPRPKSVEPAGLQQATFCGAADCSKCAETAKVPALALAALWHGGPEGEQWGGGQQCWQKSL